MLNELIKWSPLIAYISLFIAIASAIQRIWNGRYNLEIEQVPSHSVIYTDSKQNTVQKFHCNLAFLIKNKSSKSININSIKLSNSSTTIVSEYDSRFVATNHHDYMTMSGKETDLTIIRSTPFPLHIPGKTHVLVTAQLIFPTSFIFDVITLDTDKGTKDVTSSFPTLKDSLISILKKDEQAN